MPKYDAQFWNKAHLARDKLVKQYIYHPDVSLIDIGYAPEEGELSDTIALRIHVKERWMRAKPQERVSFPEAIYGIPVVVMPGDYDLSSDA
jgi:hypothetical protein